MRLEWVRAPSQLGPLCVSGSCSPKGGGRCAMALPLSSAASSELEDLLSVPGLEVLQVRRGLLLDVGGAGRNTNAAGRAGQGREAAPGGLERFIALLPEVGHGQACMLSTITNTLHANGPLRVQVDTALAGGNPTAVGVATR